MQSGHEKGRVDMMTPLEAQVFYKVSWLKPSPQVCADHCSVAGQKRVDSALEDGLILLTGSPLPAFPHPMLS